MRKIRALASVVLIIVIVLSFTALSQDENGKNGENNENNIPEFILNKSTPIVSATEFDYPPFSTPTAPEDKADGFSVELLEAALNSQDYEVTFNVDYWSEIKEDLAEGKIQVLPLVGRTPEREVIYDFTVPYITLNGAIFVRDDENEIKDVEDLKDKEVLVLKGVT